MPTSVHEITVVTLPSGARAARKGLRPEHAAREDLRLRLLREGEWLTQLGGRCHVLRCHGIDTRAPALFLEYAPGGTLADALSGGATPGTGRLLSWARVRALATALGDALSHLHAQGLVHRDVKPSNVLLAADGTPRLADLGVAAVVGSRGTLGDAWEEDAIGTLGYAAPEQLADPASAIHPASDVYAFGAVLYELCTGRLPWELEPGEDEPALRARIIGGALPPSPRVIQPAVGTAVEGVLAAALAPEPAHRPASARALVTAWCAAWDHARPTVEGASPESRTR